MWSLLSKAHSQGQELSSEHKKLIRYMLPIVYTRIWSTNDQTQLMLDKGQWNSCGLDVDLLWEHSDSKLMTYLIPTLWLSLLISYTHGYISPWMSVMKENITYPYPYHKGRQSDSIYNGPANLATLLVRKALVAAQTGFHPLWGNWVWWGRCARRCRMRSRCVLIFYRTVQK